MWEKTVPQHSVAQDEADLATALLDEIASLLSETQGGRHQPVDLDHELEDDLGIDSLGRVELVVRIEQRLGVHLPAETFAEVDTARDLLEAVLNAQQAPGSARVETITAPSTGAPLAAIPEEEDTLPDVLRWHARHSPDHVHIRLLEDGRESQVLSHRELLERAEDVAIGLQARDVQAGDRVAMMLPTGIDYFATFFAILLCGAIPVPIYPPARASQLGEHLLRHTGILKNCCAVLMVTIARARPFARLLQDRVNTLREVVTPIELPGNAQLFIAPGLRGGDTAFLQYTSGSTGDPKGVILTHADLLTSIRTMGAAIEAGPDDVFVSWLPLYHDMGLIGAWFGSLHFGIPLVIMSPLDFLARPSSWLEAIERYRGSISASPNFGYELCMKRLSDDRIGRLDLSSWRIAMNGAEPVSPSTLERFIDRFAVAGFRPEASMPVYGLAEITLGLSFPPLGRRPLIDRVDRDALADHGEAQPAAEGDTNALRLASCGRALPGYRVRVVDDRGNLRPDRRQGRIQFQGPSATAGYFDNPQATAQLYDGDWLDSGDLGYLADGELYLTGRRKDLIVRGGRNLYPHELEDAVGDIPRIRKGCVVAFGSADPTSGTERLVVMAETRVSDEQERAALTRRIRQTASELIGTPPEIVRLLLPHAVLKTSSGKIRRSANREAFEHGTLTASAGGPGLARLFLSGLPGMVRRWTHRASEYLFGVWAWLVFLMLAVLGWIGVVVLPRRRWRFAWARTMTRALCLLTATPLQVVGANRLPPRGQACVIVVNHASYLDGALLVGALPRELSFVAKAELGRQFVAGTFLRRMGTEFVDRFDTRQGIADLERIAALTRTGEALVFFAEGTFSPAPGLRPFHMGAFVTAQDAQIPVLPVAIAGNRQVMGPDRTWPRRGRLVVTVGEPIEPPPSSDKPGENWRAALDLRRRAREEILSFIDEPDLAPGDRG